MTVFPDFLRAGDKIAIISPSGAVEPAYIDGACAVLEQWGFVPVLGTYCKGKQGKYAGTQSERLQDFIAALTNNKIKAILCSRGGYGAVHLLEKLPASLLRDHAKWLIGFSDISLLHAAMYHAGVASIHASMAKQLALFGADNNNNKLLCHMLTGQLPTYRTPTHSFNRMGTVTGELIGGNLAVLCGLLRTDYDLFQADKILFIEDIAEPIYKVERMLYNLRLAGVLANLKGLIVGRFTEHLEPDANGDTMYSMIQRLVADYDYPVAYDFPIGHIDENVPLIEGATVKFAVTATEVLLDFQQD
ncbi:LD-carboxypeptidase [Gallibacterium salpingitidis]|uniref:S66 peptidase family protein n=1 Tax=Gallibacterium salpingitidis TaxID=505341 RepID=UPI0026701348|nr:LD-carboxypeptidase [Gallibacterium salpingitidis]WKT00770.1 LD-carboxypeptidase [Gallibacterium salpingitidis]